MQLIDFMRELGDGILDHLPEEQRTGQLPTEEIIEQWMAKKSYFAALSLRRDVTTYIKLQRSGNLEVDEILSWYDLCFIPERFGIEEHIFLTSILDLIDSHIEKKRKAFFAKCFGWVGYK
ncbi:hypothetical protein GIV19_26480 [Pseudomonas syringae]|nr:hypothetical protein [Pseudomonas syringae]